jgi:hypothetical protein
MLAHRLMLAPAETLFRVAGALLGAAPALIAANHLFATPFGAQLEHDFDSAAASWPSPSLSAELHALGATSGARQFSDIRVARLTAERPPSGESS